MEQNDKIEDSIHKTSSTAKDIAILVGIVIAVITFFVTRPEFQALAKQTEDNRTILKNILNLQCKSARVNDKLTAKDVDEFCKQL